jgi:hypothetical protein
VVKAADRNHPVKRPRLESEVERVSLLDPLAPVEPFHAQAFSHHLNGSESNVHPVVLGPGAGKKLAHRPEAKPDLEDSLTTDRGELQIAPEVRVLGHVRVVEAPERFIIDDVNPELPR